MKISDLKAGVIKGLAAMFVLATLTVTALSQAGTSGVSGTVRDNNGAAVPGATVKLTNAGTGFERTTTTNEDGSFSFVSVPPATYQLEVTASGFKKLVNTSLVLAVDTTAKFDPQLEAGDVSAVVNVTSSTIESIVNTTDAAVGNSINSQQITQLPTDLRRVNDLITLQPGVTRDGYVAGGRSDQANITLDGVDINDQQTGGRAGTGDLTLDSALRATTESIEEFRVTTVGANADQGRSSGAQINIITKTGSNTFSGAAFYFRRPTFGSANSFFNNLSGVERPTLDRDLFGGAIGGPIIKDKFFFHYSYEAQRQNLDVEVNNVVPLEHLGQGSLRFVGTLPGETPCTAPGVPAGCTPQRLLTLSQSTLNSVYSAAGINQAAVDVLRGAATRYRSNNTEVGDGLNTGGFRFNAPTTDSENTHQLRLNYNLNSNQQLSFRGNYQWDNATGASAWPDTINTNFWSHPIGILADHNWTISNNKVNNFRYGLARQAFTATGDSNANGITFRFVYSPFNFSRTLSRVTTTHNFTDDFSWIKGNHTVKFGGNVRIIRNHRETLGNAYDFATTNPSFYASSGAVVDGRLRAAGYSIAGGSVASVQAGATALIGRYSQYTGQFNYDINGNVLPAGTPTIRNFATEEYDSYVQDVWKIRPSVTLTMGLRYAVSRPVYEQDGFQVIPSIPLGDYFERRRESAAAGVPFNGVLNFQLAGPKNNAPGFYKMDWNNFQPRVAVAWSPDFESGFLRTLFGKKDESVIRGGFGIFNDYFGGQLAVSFDGLTTLGFTTQDTIAANTYNVTTRLAPQFTGFNQNIRGLPNISAPNRFQTPADEDQRIESSLDSTIKSPTHYTWNVSYGRQLPKQMYFEATYIGRMARDLFGARDVMALNNLRDPLSGQDWYGAAGQLHDLRLANTTLANVPRIAYFENFFPNLGANFWGDPSLSATQSVYLLAARDCGNNARRDPNTGNCPAGSADIGGFDILDWTFVQLLIDDFGTVPNLFYQPQYAAFSAFGTFANSDYHGGTFTLRQRLGNTLRYDINYTFSKSMDDVSGLQTDGSYGGQFLLNPLRQEDQYSLSDFDSKHVLNANFIFDLPVGRGRAYFSDMSRWADALLGGWSLRGIYRWNTGQPFSPPFDQAQWATNWNVQSNGTRVRGVEYGAFRDTRNVFANPQAAFNSFRNARPGETGERNTLRGPMFQNLDLAVSKEVTMPWNENHKFQFRWEVFNVANWQYFAITNQTRTTYGLPQDPDLVAQTPGVTTQAASTFGRIFGDIQGTPRRMQFGLRYAF